MPWGFKCNDSIRFGLVLFGVFFLNFAILNIWGKGNDYKNEKKPNKEKNILFALYLK